MRLFRQVDNQEEEVAPESEPDVVVLLLQLLREWDPPHPPGQPDESSPVSDRERQLLEELGYVDFE